MTTTSPRPAGSDASPPVARAAPTSIAPVGLEMADGDAPVEEPKPSALQTASLRAIVPRRRLGGIVVGTVSLCALILVAAVIARVSHASSKADAAPLQHHDAPPVVPAAPPAPAASPVTDTAAAAPPATAPADIPPPPTDSGVLRFVHPAKAWLDGKKLTSSTAIVACGAHQLKIGRGRVHTVQVPCGGELVLK